MAEAKKGKKIETRRKTLAELALEAGYKVRINNNISIIIIIMTLFLLETHNPSRRICVCSFMRLV